MHIGRSYLDSDFSYTVMLILLIDHYLDVIVPTFHLVDVVYLFVFVLVSSCLYITEFVVVVVVVVCVQYQVNCLLVAVNMHGTRG